MNRHLDISDYYEISNKDYARLSELCNYKNPFSQECWEVFKIMLLGNVVLKTRIQILKKEIKELKDKAC